eukprot:s690_g29.t1
MMLLRIFGFPPVVGTRTLRRLLDFVIRGASLEMPIISECPIVRSIGLDVEKNGLVFVWFPGSLPYYVRDPSACEIKCEEDNKFYASRVQQNVPFFRTTFDVIPGMPAEPALASDDIDAEFPPDRAAEPVAVPDVLSVEPAVEPSLEPGEPSVLPPAEHEILAPPMFDHMLTHFPKLSTCDVCNRVRLYSKRAKSTVVFCNSYPVSQFHDTEVYMPGGAVFPLASAAEAALKELDDPRLSELHDVDAVPVPFVDAEIKRKTRRVYVTYARMLKIGATKGCKGCENDTSAHNAECIARFEEAFGRKEADGPFVEPEVPVSSDIPAIGPMHVDDDFEL